MSLNQSKPDKNESQYRKPGGGRSGNSGQQRTFSGGTGRGGGGGSTAPPLVTNSSSVSSTGTRSQKKIHNAQGVQSRVVVGSVNAAGSAPSPIQNGSHSLSTNPTHPPVTLKPNDLATHRNIAPIPRAPSSQSAAPVTSDSAPAPKTPTKGDGAKGFPLQFGSISPGFMNGMQVPARTTSAPPNIDELKRDQAQHAAMKGTAAIPVAALPKPHVPRKDVPVPQHIAGEPNAALKVKREASFASAPPVSQAQKPPVLSMTGMPIQVPYSQPSMPMQFGGPNPQMQSQGMTASSLPIPVVLQMGNPPQMQQHMFMPGLQHPMMQPQGLMHQSQNMGFNPQMTQHSHQIGSPGMNIAPHLSSPQQPVKYGNARKAVKITHPETHEELRLDKKMDAHSDGTSASRAHHNVQPQPYPSSHQMGYFPNAYAASPHFTAPSNTLPSSAQMTSIPQHSTRFNYPASQAPHSMPFASRSASSTMPTSKGGTVAHNTVAPSSLDSSRVNQNVPLSSPVLVTIKPAVTPSTDKSTDIKPAEKGETLRLSRPEAEMSSLQSKKDGLGNPDKNLPPFKSGSEQVRPSSASIDENVVNETSSSISASSHGESSTLETDGVMKETVTMSEPAQENLKKPVNKEHDQLVHQFDVQASTSLSRAVENTDDSSKTSSSPPFEVKKLATGSAAGHGTGPTHLEQSSGTRASLLDDGSSGAVNDLQSPACDAPEVDGTGYVEGKSDDYAEQQDPPQTSGSGKPGEKENLAGEKHKDGMIDVDSLKPAQIAEKANPNVELEENIHGTGHVDTSDRHVQSSTYEQHSESVMEVKSLDYEGDTVVPSEASAECSRPEKESTVTTRPTSSGSVPNLNKTSAESNKTRAASARGKKNFKQILQRADAQGNTSDLYMAYKGSDEKIESSCSIESSENYETKALSGELNQDVAVPKDDQSKAEPDDWEDAADVSTPKLQSISNRTHELAGHDVDEAGTKKYSRDFLLTFSEQYTTLPESVDIFSDIKDILSRPSSSSSRIVDHPSPGRNTDRPSSGHKTDRRAGGIGDGDRWNKHGGPFPSPRDMGQDTGYGPMPMGFRPGQGGNHGGVRNLRGPPSGQHPILSGPMHSMQRNNTADADRWRNPNFKGLMPSPQTHMHKAERKYEVGKVTDEEQAKQRKLKGILNKLTPQNFEKLFAQVKEVNIDNVITLTGVISQIFDKALMEPTFCEMYSNFCYQLSLALPELSVDDEKVTFKRLLLNKCQEEFERGEKEEEEANIDESGKEIELSDAQREEIRIKARRRMLGNIRLIGELYKKSMLTERIMHECIRTLLGQYPNSVEEDIESLCKLMSTIGEMIDHPRGKDYMDSYFSMMAKLSNDMKLSSRVRFMLKDAIDLRKNKWQQRRKVEGPKKIEDVHRDAAQEKHAQSSRLNRGPSMGSGMRRGQPIDFSPRGTGMLSSPVGQPGNFRGMPQTRGYAMQDARIDERNSFNSRANPVPLPHRPLSGDDSITLGPQGGLARGMLRGQPSAAPVPATDHSLSHGDTRRTGGLNGFSSVSNRGAINSREEPAHRYTPPERPGVSQSNMHDLAAPFVHRDHILDRPIPTSTPARGQGILSNQNMSLEKELPEERLREKSIATIREFYSAKDEKEVDTCVRELNAPNSNSSVISTWVADSFDRKDLERTMLNELIVNLSKNRKLFMPDQLIKGFETVLAALEDTVSDAPKAPEYLGRLFSMLIIENILSLKDIGRLLYDAGEEPGCVREAGLAGDVLGSILENIRSIKGEPAMREICASSSLRLADFRPPDPFKSRKLELFI